MRTRMLEWENGVMLTLVKTVKVLNAEGKHIACSVNITICWSAFQEPPKNLRCFLNKFSLHSFSSNHFLIGYQIHYFDYNHSKDTCSEFQGYWKKTITWNKNMRTINCFTYGFSFSRRNRFWAAGSSCTSLKTCFGSNIFGSSLSGAK